MKSIKYLVVLVLTLVSCSLASSPTVQPAPLTEEFIQPQATSTQTAIPATLAPPTETLTLVPPTETSTPTEIPVVESLKAQVTADLLSCRYGPGSEYLYLFAFRNGAKIEIVGQTGGNSWVLVENKPQRCWVNTKFLNITGDPKTLKVMYPDGASPHTEEYISRKSMDTPDRLKFRGRGIKQITPRYP